MNNHNKYPDKYSNGSYNPERKQEKCIDPYHYYAAAPEKK